MRLNCIMYYPQADNLREPLVYISKQLDFKFVSRRIMRALKKKQSSGQLGDEKKDL